MHYHGYSVQIRVDCKLNLTKRHNCIILETNQKKPNYNHDSLFLIYFMEKPLSSKDVAIFFSIICVHNTTGHAPDFLLWPWFPYHLHWAHRLTPYFYPRRNLPILLKTAQNTAPDSMTAVSSNEVIPQRYPMQVRLHDTPKSFKHWSAISCCKQTILTGFKTTLTNTLNWKTNKTSLRMFWSCRKPKVT